LTFNAQFNFCYPQPFQAFDRSKNFGTKLSKISPRPFRIRATRLVASRGFHRSPTARLLPWREGQSSRFFLSVNRFLSKSFVAAFTNLIPFRCGVAKVAVSPTGSKQISKNPWICRDYRENFLGRGASFRSREHEKFSPSGVLHSKSRQKFLSAF
jgi:hypothetical protein